MNISQKTEEDKNFTKHSSISRDSSSLSTLQSDSQTILENARLGLWEIRIDMENQRYELYADEMMHKLMGLKETLSPTACYHYWYSRINAGYYNYVGLAVENSIQTGKPIQVEYTWSHPEKGDVSVRCMALRTKDQNGMICLEGYHRIINDLDRLDFLPGSLQSEMFEYNEQKHSIYFHTKRKMIAGEKIKEEHFPECWIKKQIVHPHFIKEFRSIFQNIQNHTHILGKEMLFRTKKGTYEWFKLKIGRFGEENSPVVAVLMDPANEERNIELTYIRKSNFYQALLSETAAHAEIDVESGHVVDSSGLWKFHQTDCQRKNIHFNESMQTQALSLIYPEDQALYQKYLNLPYMKKMYKQGIPSREFSLRCMVDEHLCWMKIVLHVFQDRYTENMYALVYMQDIDAEKRKELAQALAAQTDPLTHVLNRNIFEEEVVHFMTSHGKSAHGALILFDLDNFKKINDTYGHLKGDELLKNLCSLLQQNFRSQDLVGRLGGDEFLVFVKNISDPEILNKRLDDLFSQFFNTENSLLSCSAGISIVNGKSFVYQEELWKADTALYQSKARGKNQYSYYDDQAL